MLIHELRFALRRLWKAKSFTLTAALTLAIGIGTATKPDTQCLQVHNDCTTPLIRTTRK